MTDQEVRRQEEVEKAERDAYYEKKFAPSRITTRPVRSALLRSGTDGAGR